jgi:hypothetical protein
MSCAAPAALKLASLNYGVEAEAANALAIVGDSAPAESLAQDLDSLLIVNFFLSRRGAENPLSFFPSSSTQSARIGSRDDWTQPGSVVRLMELEHGEQSM